MKTRRVKIFIILLWPFLLSHPQTVDHRNKDRIMESFNISVKRHALDQLKSEIKLLELSIGIIKTEIEMNIDDNK